MTDIQARRAREIKALSGVVAALSLPIYASAAFFFDAWDARVVSLYVGSVILTIAIGLQIYVRRPAAFGVTEIGDSLRTGYTAPSAASATVPQPVTSMARPAALVGADRVSGKHLLLQCVTTIGVVTLYAVTVVAVSGVLVVSPGWAFFVAAAVILGAFFWFGQSFAVGAVAQAPTGSTTAEPVAIPETPSRTTPHAA